MPSQNPRIALTVKPEIDDVLTKLSKLTKKPKTKIINEFLEELLPVFELIEKNLMEVEKTKQALPSLVRFAALANEQTAVINKELAYLVQQQDWVDND